MAEIPSQAIFTAGAAKVASFGVKLTRRIEKRHRDFMPGFAPNPKVYWTWGDGDLMEMIPRR